MSIPVDVSEAARPRGAKPPSPRRRAREFLVQGLYQAQIGGQDEAAIQLQAKTVAGFSNADKALYNAGRNYEQIRKWDSATKAFEKLLSRYKSSPLADKAIFRIAQNSENFFEFDRAVQAYLRLYREFPQSDKRSFALYNAALSLENDQRYAEACSRNSSA